MYDDALSLKAHHGSGVIKLLFKLRGVDHTELITLGTAVSDMTKPTASRRRRTLDSDAVNDVFGLDLDD